MSAAPTPQTRAEVQSKCSRVRWRILGMLFAVTTLNYADRATIAIGGPEISKALQLSPVQMGYVFSAFAWSYVVAQLPCGWLLDRFGSKKVYFWSITLWSLFTMLCGFTGFLTGAAAMASLFGLRLLVGAAEAPALPANSRVTSAWFPTNERGSAAAFFNSAQYFSTVLFGPFMGWIVQKFGWQSLFLVMGGLGFGVAWMWLRMVHSPLQHPSVNAAELAHIESGGALVRIEEGGPTQKDSSSNSWNIIRQLLSSRMLVGIYIAQYGITTLTYFFLTWFPVYLVKERHMTILNAGFVAALPAVAGFIGGILGGILSDRLLKSGYSQSTARKTPIVLGMLAAMTMVACNYVQTDWLVIAVMSLAFFGKGVGALGWAVVADTSPPEAGGLSGSLFNTFGNIAGITTPIVIGYIIQRTGSFANALVFIGANALVAIVCYLFVVGEIKRFTLKPVA